MESKLFIHQTYYDIKTNLTGNLSFIRKHFGPHYYDTIYLQNEIYYENLDYNDDENVDDEDDDIGTIDDDLENSYIDIYNNFVNMYNDFISDPLNYLPDSAFK